MDTIATRSWARGRSAKQPRGTIFQLTLLLCGVMCVASGSSADGRLVVELLDNWRFQHGDVQQAEDASFDDTSWRTVSVPHDWSIAGPFDESNPAGGDGAFLPTGVAWYRKQLPNSASDPATRTFIEFDGVMANSDVWVNGHHLGHRPNGYVTFRYELTDHLHRGNGAVNVVAVRTDTEDQVASRWYTGSGIYRIARLIVVDAVHIDDRSVFVTTPTVSSTQATVRVMLDLVNTHGLGRDAVMRVDLRDEAGDVVATRSVSANLAADSTTSTSVDLEMQEPRLWDPRDPVMHAALTTVIDDGVEIDQVETPFGIRKAEFRPETGFWLNDRNIKIKGVCLHHDGGAFGAAVPASVWHDRLTKLRRLGVNAVRTAHNPPSPELLDLCDRLGLLVMDEFFDCWTVGKRDYDYHLHFEEWSRRDAEDTIRRDRNHPSVILYSVGNEIRDTPRERRAKRILNDLVNVCHQNDPTRPVTQGLFRPNSSGDYDNGLADMLDVIGTNYRDRELLEAWREKPSRKIIGTEQSHERSTWLACRDRPHHSGQFLWVGIDYLGESRRWPVTTFNSGLLDRTGYPHPRAYERQSWWSDKPMVHVFRRIAPTEVTPTDPGYEDVEWERRRVLFDDWTPQDLDAHVENVEVYSNCEEVELMQDGKSLGIKDSPQDARPRTWQVDFTPGELVAIGRNGGQEVARHTVRTAGPAHGIQLSCNRESLAPVWNEVAIVEAQIVDSEGNPAPRADHSISFSVEGPGSIVAVDNGSIVSHEPFHATSRHTHHGRCVAMIRSTSEEGEIRIVARSDGLAAGAARLSAGP